MSNFKFTFGEEVPLTPTNFASDAAGEMWIARTNAAKAQKEAKAARQLEQLIKTVTALQEQQEAQAKELRDNRAETVVIRKLMDAKDAEIKSKDEQINNLEAEISTLQAQVRDTRDKLGNEVAATKQAEGFLRKSYADNEDLKATLKAAENERDTYLAQFQAKQDELELLMKEWSSDQEKVAQLEQAESNCSALQAQLEELHREIEEQRSEFEEKDNTIKIKDARIKTLESDLQRALKNAERAQAAVEAVASPAAPPTIFDAGDDSLEAELGAVEDEQGLLGDESEELYESMDRETQTDIKTFDNQGIQTDTKTSDSQGVQTDSNIFDHQDVQTETRSVQIEGVAKEQAIQTEHLTFNKTSATQTEKATATEPELMARVPITSSMTTYLFPLFCAILVHIILFLYIHLQRWQAANYAGSGSRGGAYGRVYYLFGFIPVGGSIGDSYLSESVTKFFVYGFQQLEDWTGRERMLF